MISRSATKLIAEVYNYFYQEINYTKYQKKYYRLNTDKLYDSLYERDYEAWFLNLIKNLSTYGGRNLLEFIMKIHTGETLSSATLDWSWEQREKLGQRYLKDLAEDIIEYCEVHDFGTHVNELIHKLKSQLELDGYIWKEKKLLFSEADILDAEEEKGILENLVNELNLDNQQTVLHHLELSEKHYIDKKWDDSISNSRKFLESIFQEVAAKHNMVEKKVELSNSIYSSPKDVRDYLTNNGLIEEKEKKAIASVYGLLSGTGAHPYIAEQDQARLLRHMALTFCQFVMLRLKGYISQKT